LHDIPFIHSLAHSFVVSALCADHVALLQIADTITELKLGNGTSVLIFANIASALPTSVGAALSQAASKDSANVAIYAGAFFLTTLGIVYVQEAERKIPMNYASRYRNSALSRQSYLPFKVSSFSQIKLLH
jgi:protein transport protein SEC61 subunit alpha